ncbi:hypothetical protein FACS1894166_02980 [Bacilli bacterium]|nr:hypothetical protein FACS1894166_02980 [Bacilli bacterium]
MTITENLHFERYDTVETGILRHILRQTKGQYQNTNIRPDLIPFDKFEGVTSIPKIQALVAQAEATTRQLHPKRLRDKSYKRDADDNYILDTHGKKKLIKNGTTRIVEAVFTFNIGNSQPLTPYEKTKFNA